MSMNVKKFMRDLRVGRNDYNTVEAAERLDIEPETIRYFVRMGVIKPVEGAVEGRVTILQSSKLKSSKNKSLPIFNSHIAHNKRVL